MDPAIKMAQWLVYGLGVALWIGALVFVGFRLHQMRTLSSVYAEVVDAGAKAYVSKGYARDATGHTYETRSRMYAAAATVRYTYQGQEHTAEASHDVGISSRWFQERLTRQWQPGTRIRVYLDPSKPDEPLAGLGFNLNTFAPSLGLVLFGFLLMGVGYGLGRLAVLLKQFGFGLP